MKKEKRFSLYSGKYRWVILLIVLLLVVFGFYLRYIKNLPWAGWTGFESKTLWDVMELFIIPLVLAIGGFLLNKAERSLERELEENRIESQKQISAERWQESTMQSYLDIMTELLLDKGLNSSSKDSEIRRLARARTLTVLPALDKNRQRFLLRFLYETKLINSDDPVVSLSTLELQEADLGFILLRGANLRGVNFQKANLQGADLMSANLRMADFNDSILALANLENTNLQKVDFFRAKLNKTRLSGADLTESKLIKADLRQADFRGARLCGIDLTLANLEKATLKGAILDDNIVISDTIMPDGSKSDLLADLHKFV